MADLYVYVTKEMLGYLGSQPNNPPGINQGQDGFGLYAPDVTDLSSYLGLEADYYRLGGTQLVATDTHFRNGQWWALEAYTGTGDPRDDADPSNWKTIYTQMTPKQDLVSNLDGGDDYIVLEVSGVHIMLDLAAPFSSEPITKTYGDLASPGELTFEEAEDAFEEKYVVVCFTSGTMILTDRGEVAIDDLREGDLVMTRDNGLQPIRWIGSRRLSASALIIKPNLRPIRISAGALGQGLPAQDLLVSPQHRVLVRSHIAQRMFGTDEVLVAAKQLLQLEGVDIATDMASVEYFHMLFDRHEVVISNGAETESLYTGPEALKALPAAAVEEILTLFPELRDEGHIPAPARLLASGRMARRLTVRHLQNNRPMIGAN